MQRLNASLEQNLAPLRQIIANDQQEVVTAAQSNPLIIPAALTTAITLFVGLLLWGVYAVVVRPIRQLTAATAAMAAGEARREININSGDEIGILARSFNSMTEAVEAQQQQLRERAATLEAANAAQQQLLETVRVLSVPTIPLNDGVLLLPLMGAIDNERARHLSKTLLTAVEQQRAHTVILDCTGLTTPDAETIRYLTDTTRALRLLGAQTICTGIQPAFAQALSQAGLRLEAAAIYATVGEGVAATSGAGAPR
jgi:anti-anti-sigma regulatory factor/HAMP domain-containing protein